MGKQSKLDKATITKVRKKIRAEVKKNRDLQAVVDRHQQIFAGPTSKQARANENRKVYTSLIKNNKTLSDAARAIFDSMKPRP